MDQITVSDIPLPGEAFPFKTNEVVEEKTIEQSQTETLEATQNLQSVIEQTIEQCVEVKETIIQETEADGIAEEFMHDVSTNDSDCMITENVAELQMEVEQAVAESNMAADNVAMETSQNNDNQEPIVLDDSSSVSMDTANDISIETANDISIETANDISIETANDSIETADVSVETVNFSIEINVERTNTVDLLNSEEGTIDLTEENEGNKIPKTNSTIEAIKNDWSDNLTIEEVSEEVEETDSLPEPVITEPDKAEDNVSKPELETEVIVLETIQEETVAENITVEIVDNNLSHDEVVVESTEQSLVESTVAEQITVGESTVVQQSPIEENKQDKQNETKEAQNTRRRSPRNSEPDNLLLLSEVSENSVNREKIEKPKEVQMEMSSPEEDRKAVSTKVPKPKGRVLKNTIQREDNLQIPCHVLGRNIDNPTEDLISNGRTPPKPRLGVKVPYRFLTSQIVSKEEIADELDALVEKRNPDREMPAGGDIIFASKLTQRLANKIAMNVSKKKQPETSEPQTVEESTSGIPTEALISAEDPADQSGTKNQNTIENNSDLLAILEGDVDVDWAKEVGNNAKTNEAETKEVGTVETVVEDKNRKVIDPYLERQIALKQLRDMPKLKYPGRGRPRKYHYVLEPIDKPLVGSPKPANKPSPEIKKEPEKPIVNKETNENIKQAVNISSKINENKDDDIDLDLSLTPRRVTKTYSRKEAVLDVPADLERIVNDTELNSALQDSVDEMKSVTEENGSKTAETNEKKTEEQSPAKQKKKDKVEKEKKVEETKLQKKRKQKRESTETNKSEITLVSKRARVIKRKVIWDPAEVPKTKVLNAIRRAQAQEMKARKERYKKRAHYYETSESEEEEEEKEEKTKDAQKQDSKTVEEKTDKPQQQKQPQQKQKKKETKEKTEETSESEEETKDAQKQDSKTVEEKTNKVRQQKQSQQQQQKKKERKEITEEIQGKEMRQLRKKIVPRATLSKIQKKKLLITRPLRSLTGKLIRSTNSELKSSINLTKKKKQVMAAMAKSARDKPRKTELDRLLGDEGAVNMLYSVKNKGIVPPKTYMSQKELQSRKKQLRDVITTQSSQEDKTKALRKKDSPLPPMQVPVRKKSRDSVRSSLQSPPPSPSFFLHSRAEASRIIRRHSSSFSSDSSSPRRLSVDQQQKNKTESNDETSDFQSPTRTLRRKVETKPEEKVKTDKLTQAEKRKLNAEMSKNFDKHPKKRTRSSKGEEIEEEEVKTTKFVVVQTEYKELILKKLNNFYQIIMSPPTNAKLRDVISLQMFQELSSVITKLSKDENCKVLAITSNGKSFCNGLDFSHLVQTTAEKRTAAAQEMSKALKNFILTIAKFPKPLLASLHSSASLLGCTMLPYFDVVLASEAATLSADYTRLGHGPEGAAHLTFTRKNATEFLILGKKFTAKESLEIGLINVVEKKEKLDEALMKIGVEMSEKSQQSLIATKSLLRYSLLQDLGEALDREQKLLIEHWPSSLCQQQFKKLLTEQELW